MKLNNTIKSFIRRGVYNMSIIELKFLISTYGIKKINRALRIINYIRYKKNLVLIRMYKNCTIANSNYYNWNIKQLEKYGYIKENNFYIKKNFATIAYILKKILQLLHKKIKG